MPLVEFPTPKRNPTPTELAELVGKGFENLEYLLNGFLGSLNIKELKADKISAGTILAAVVTIKAELDSGGSIVLDGTGLHISDGTKETFSVGLDGKPIMTGGTVRSKASGYPVLEFNSASGILTAKQDENTRINLNSDGIVGNNQSLEFINNDAYANMVLTDTPGNMFILVTPGGTDIQISAGKDLRLNGNNIYVPSFYSLKDKDTEQSLQNALNAKANAFAGYTGNITVMTSPTTSLTMQFSNGILSSIS